MKIYPLMRVLQKQPPDMVVEQRMGNEYNDESELPVAEQTLNGPTISIATRWKTSSITRNGKRGAGAGLPLFATR